MLQKGPAKKVTIYLNEDAHYHVGPLYEAILTFLFNKGVAGATVTRGMAGFGAHHRMHTAKVELLADHLPIRIEFVETTGKTEELLPTLYDMVTDGLIDVQDTTIVKHAIKEKKSPQPREPHEIRESKAKLMRIFMGEADRWHGEPLYEAVLKRLRMMEIAGGTVYRGILGYGSKGHTHKQSLLHLSHDLPVMIFVVDEEEKILQAAQAVLEMLTDGLIVLSDERMIRLVHSKPTAEGSHANLPAS